MNVGPIAGQSVGGGPVNSPVQPSGRHDRPIRSSFCNTTHFPLAPIVLLPEKTV
jgi:hypothetical protein